MTWRATLVAAALLLASSVSAQERLFLPSGEVSISNPFGSVIGPTYGVLRHPRVGGNRYAEIVFMTHEAREAAVQQAMAEIRTLDVVERIGSVIRVEG